MYVPWNAPIKVLGTASRKIVFGRVESGDEAIASSLEGDGDGDGDGDDGDVGDVDGTTGGGGVHSTRVKTALLAEESQHMRQTRRTRSNDLPGHPSDPQTVRTDPLGVARDAEGSRSSE